MEKEETAWADTAFQRFGCDRSREGESPEQDVASREGSFSTAGEICCMCTC